MIYNTKPRNFSSRFEIVSCFLEKDKEFLILHRQDHKPEGNTWCLPSGKVEKSESLEQAMAREIQEETGLVVNINFLSHFKKLYVKYDDYDFIYHIFHLKTEEKPEIILEEKGHKDFKWVTPIDSLKENLIPDLDECVKIFYKIK